MRTTLTSLLCLVWLCLAYLPAHAQTETPSSTTDSLPTRYKWEVATDLLWLVKQDSMFAPSIFIRRHTKNGAWRLRLGGGYRHDISEPKSPSTIPFPEPIKEGKFAKTYFIFGKFGYQWTRKMPLFSLYYGADVFLNRIKIHGDEYIWENGKNFHYMSVTKKYQAGGIFFVGLQKTFWKKLSVSGEMGISAYYDYYDYLKTQYEYPVDDLTSKGWSFNNKKRWEANVLPLYVLNLSYHF